MTSGNIFDNIIIPAERIEDVTLPEGTILLNSALREEARVKAKETQTKLNGGGGRREVLYEGQGQRGRGKGRGKGRDRGSGSGAGEGEREGTEGQGSEIQSERDLWNSFSIFYKETFTQDWVVETSVKLRDLGSGIDRLKDKIEGYNLESQVMQKF